jgi:diguanylate cyclase
MNNLEMKVMELQAEVQKWRALASRDELTSCLRREAFFSLIDERRRFGLLPKDITLLVIDVDHFKKINDTFGHFGGDQVLRVLGQTLNKLSSEGGLVCRMGGEEFVIALPKSHVEGTIDAIALRESIENLNVQLNIDTHVTFTVSIGVAAWNTDRSFLEAAAQADEALYEAKNSGRNRIVTFQKRAA